MKYAYNELPIDASVVAPARERGLKYYRLSCKRETALVAPARERGLKFGGVGDAKDAGRRSRKGAWIEIS